MELTSENVGQVALDLVVDATVAIYANHDQHRSIWDVWSHSLHHAAAVAEEIRKNAAGSGNNQKLWRETADLTLWFFTMLVKLKGPLGVSRQTNETPQDLLVRISASPSDLMWNRYPGLCPWCYGAAHEESDLQIAQNNLWLPCRCDSLGIAQKAKIPEDLQARAEWTRKMAAANAISRPYSLDDWQNSIATLYEERLTRVSLAEVALHLLEEMGEVSDGLIRMYSYSEEQRVEDLIRTRQIRLEDELADVLSWLFALVERVNIQLSAAPSSSNFAQAVQSDRFLLSQILWTKYGSNDQRAFWCRHCKSLACECQIHLIESKDQVEDLLSKIAQ